ncbi:MAG TPA: DUF1054 family protein [Candidatus Binataceae bacterium]|nr:DUF1054 family protein [Candidatus Binataceae bacterium]
MATLGFTAGDFAVFKVEGFNQRMQQIYAHVRPKLIKLGDELAPELARKTHMEFFPHVAKHARRTVNPPPETWAAFGPSPRGYKRYGYLALCISGAGLHARAVVKSEADNRSAMASNLKARAAQLVKEFKGTKISRYDKWDFTQLPEGEAATPEFFTTLAEGLAKKTGGLDLGFGWNVRESIRLDRAELLEAFRELEPLYRLLRSAA